MHRHKRRRFLKSLMAAGLLPRGTGAMWDRSTEMLPSEGSLTDIPGIRVGHFTDSRRPTGCTVVLAEAGAVAGIDVRGSAPGTRETDLLNPIDTVQQVHAVLLTGGSAFGLDAASGVVQFLEEKNIGYDTGIVRVPIVPAAVLFDLGLGDASIRPDSSSGYAACRNASTGTVQEGNVGAGAGATVGKMLGPGRAMKAGVGTCSIQVGALKVAALVAVNAAGDIIDPHTCRIIAGARTADGRRLADTIGTLKQAPASPASLHGANTALGVVATNAAFDKAGMTKIAQMSQDGMARAVNPTHTAMDGDTIFALTTGDVKEFSLSVVGALAAEVVSRAIVRAALKAVGIPGYPSARDLSQ
jgi:L-aminopeptidase/D-esterase-like protein